jgi:two-component system sensor histidine kinase QseC
LLRILFGNLIDNAIRYSGKGSEITISVSETPHHYLIDVADNGKLIEPDLRDKLFENFYRCNRETGDGAGLGLAITRDIARIHGGEIELLQKNVNQNTFSVRLIKSNDKIVCN